MGLRKEISMMVGGLHFEGRRSALCRGSKEVDLCWTGAEGGGVGAPSKLSNFFTNNNIMT